ncbi:unnamed protein product, partial [Didymodactylos carnosus]
DDGKKHSSSTGHQLRAFSTIKFEITNEASLKQCHEIDNNDYIVASGTTKKWSEMKSDYSAWNFELLTMIEESNRLKSKFLYVWLKVGKVFCEKFGMDYVSINTAQPALAAYHYVLLLDSSGSMNDDRWQNLFAGVNKLVKARITSGTADRCIIITFSSHADFFCVDKTMKEIDITKTPYSGMETKFGPAF